MVVDVDEGVEQGLQLGGRGAIAVATSATDERRAHINDPSTGEPTTNISSATMVGPDLGIADAFAAAVFVMGESGHDWIETQADYDASVINPDGLTFWSSGFPHQPTAR